MQITIRLFAGLAEAIGSSAISFPIDETSVTAGELKALLSASYPAAASQIQVSMVAVDREYAPEDTVITAQSEVALIPPVSGGEPASRDAESADGRFRITESPLNGEAMLDKVLGADHGASLLFVGTTREMTAGVRTSALHYEAYIPMALDKLQKIGENVSRQWDARCAIAHRIGLVGLTEASVIIAVSAAHRDVCYEASRYAIEELKKSVPIWKKDIGESGETWLGADPHAAAYPAETNGHQ